MYGFISLLHKEVLRFAKVSLQTILAPIVTALLYLLIFAHALHPALPLYPGVDYRSFLIPGLVMMSMLQNTFANSSSSLIQSKLLGNLIFVLLAPLSYRAFFSAYLFAAVLRGMLVGLGILGVALWVGWPGIVHPLWVLGFSLLGCITFAILGILAGIWANKFEQLAGFQNFIIMPLTFLSGVFYSVESLPPFWKQLSYFNPVFYIVDGFRFGFFGIAETAPWLSLVVVLAHALGLTVLSLSVLKRGYRLRT